MRFTSIIFLLLSLLPLSRGAEAEFQRVWPQWRDAKDFDRIGEYFGGNESSDKHRMLRTSEAGREGFYYLVRVRSFTAVAGAKFELQVIRPDSPEPKTFHFPTEVRAGGVVYELGLTGADWPGGKAAHPVAWKLALLTADGRTIAEQKSFLWEKPAK